MDTLRGRFPGHDGPDNDANGSDNRGSEYDSREEEAVRDLPPAAIGQDERRMQVRAYNFWASALQDRNFPSIRDLDPEDQADFGPYSVLLDFSKGRDDPAIVYLGEELGQECGASGTIRSLADVPGRSLLSRITDHYMQILANQAPIGFEAEFVNQRGATILYRGILLPYSSDDTTIDFIYGVINWKELADQRTTDELLLQIDQALEPRKPVERESGPLTEWADGPADLSGMLDLASQDAVARAAADFPAPSFGPGFGPSFGPSFRPSSGTPGPGFDLLDNDVADKAKLEFPTDDDADVPGFEPRISADFMALEDWLASARQFASRAHGCEDRSRRALYAAVGCAYDFALAAADAPDDFARLVADAGLTVQDRAPMTPIVKLVFGSDYDKTRLTEYAAVLGHAVRIGLERGALAGFLAQASGGLKGIIAEERRLRRGESRPHDVSDSPRKATREALARKLRRLDTHALSELPSEGSEFTLLVARRLPDGQVVLLGEVAEDAALTERAARHLLKHD